jgi:hypothetical protein
MFTSANLRIVTIDFPFGENMRSQNPSELRPYGRENYLVSLMTQYGRAFAFPRTQISVRTLRFLVEAATANGQVGAILSDRTWVLRRFNLYY